MTQTAADASTIWAPAIRQRRKAMLQRIVMGAATALVFSPMLGWRFSATWLVIYTLIQFLEAEVFAPVVAGKVTEPTGWRGIYGDLVLVLNAGFFGVMAVPLWTVGGPMGGVAASVLLSAGMINSVIMSAGSMRIFAATVLPQLAIFALTPLFMARMGAEPHIVTAVSVGILSYTVFCLNTRRSLFRANRAETAARIEADRKREEAEAVMASRSAFLAAVAHDLRTPISSIRSRLMARPRPEPPKRAATPSAVWSKGVKRRRCCSAVMPGPVSSMWISRTWAPCSSGHDCRRRVMAPSSVNFIALEIRLLST